MGEVHGHGRSSGRGVLEGESGGLHAPPRGTSLLWIFGFAAIDVVDVLIDPISLLPLETHQGLQLLPLPPACLPQLFETIKRLAGDASRLVATEPQEVEIHVESKR